MIRSRAHDAHVHLSSLSPDADHSVAALLSAMDSAQVERAAVVTPGTMGWDNEVTFGAVEAHPERFVAIVRVNPEAPDVLPRLTEALERGARGLRLTLFDRHDDLLSDPGLSAIAELLTDHGAVMEMHARPDQLDSVARLAQVHPSLAILVDHLGRPDTSVGPEDDSYAAFRALAAYPNVVAKTPNSSYFSHSPSPYPDLAPHLEYALDAWGADRLMWGSDWPLCVARDTYRDAFEPLVTVLERRSSQEREAVLRTTFERVLMDASTR